MKQQCRLALRDLDEGTVWLKHSNVTDDPALLGFVDLTIQRATSLLNLVEKDLNAYGDGAMLLG